jgi:hypothetical protein
LLCAEGARSATLLRRVVARALRINPKRLARFEREAHAIAAILHPIILAIHGVGAHDRRMRVVTGLLLHWAADRRINQGGQ